MDAYCRIESRIQKVEVSVQQQNGALQYRAGDLSQAAIGRNDHVSSLSAEFGSRKHPTSSRWKERLERKQLIRNSEREPKNKHRRRRWSKVRLWILIEGRDATASCTRCEVVLLVCSIFQKENKVCYCHVVTAARLLRAGREQVGWASPRSLASPAWRVIISFTEQVSTEWRIRDTQARLQMRNGMMGNHDLPTPRRVVVAPASSQELQRQHSCWQ